MKRKRRTMVFFGVCAAAVLGAMAWLTVQVLELEEREAAAKRDLQLQQNIRLALWRMDSFALLFMATESARPHMYYNSLYSPEQAYYLTQGAPGGTWAVACADDFRVPSPLLRAEPDYCRLHFQIEHNDKDASARLTSPRYPPSVENREFAINTQNIPQEELVRAAGLMEQLKGMANPETLLSLARAVQQDAPAPPAPLPAAPSVWRNEHASSGPRQAAQIELSQRRQTANQAMNAQQSLGMPLSMDALETEISSLTPVWLGADSADPQLVLLRTVRIKRAWGNEETVQGVWVDWPELRTAMLEKVRDIFPNAELLPADLRSDEPERLATIPAVLRTGGAFAYAAPLLGSSRSPVLIIAWAGVLAALVAVGIVVRAIIDLGERRGRFVSAVTHELRTPLTTFCLYSEMLADGMVRDERAREQYLGTLKHESQRLARIVENVLCYARLAEVRASAHMQQLDAFDLVERSVPAMERRAEEAGMRLVSDLDAARGVQVHVDAQTVERILMNLVDNACKYAKGHRGPDGREDNRIHLQVAARPGSIDFIVADHGPGIPRNLRRTVFTPFNRSRTKTESTAPGLGLGLSLARGLARELGGDLRLCPTPHAGHHGTVMMLTLPATMRALPDPVGAVTAGSSVA